MVTAGIARQTPTAASIATGDEILIISPRKLEGVRGRHIHHETQRAGVTSR
jgi:hypothetical protein